MVNGIFGLTNQLNVLLLEKQLMHIYKKKELQQKLWFFFNLSVELIKFLISYQYLTNISEKNFLLSKKFWFKFLAYYVLCANRYERYGEFIGRTDGKFDMLEKNKYRVR